VQQTGDGQRASAYLWLLGGILALYAAVIGYGGSTVGPVLRLALLALLVVATARLRTGARQWIIAFSLATVVGGGLALWLGSRTLGYAVVGACSVVVIATAVTAIAASLLRRRVIDFTTVLGALCIYLLLALFFAGLHQALGAYVPHYLNGTADPATPADLLYFSLITLTTVGFGDITPGTQLARAVAGIEALVGQLYLVSVVAAVVSSARRPGREP
jgi:hypothetical protein